ncbi:microtubule-actin cross-linking factor 1, isoforms 1/2/3/5-like isoform X2 [Lates japonicus]|uniref:Microtubule-actin cross-linking factor 1, isoforms 1/2/3/5-like isoform X2 n=1 Tax=Lates japonicus TaxID=270547 RepID=A0AAD3NEK2_LATJO|nr:microtubule-actin cross-linking factor 1, isoforms 1/2/3/5-like isoform X2 [Lates japonicus]GLD69835.1 microtubule-actin cross-linking factor 1, isoforms 1/2/3/5-like isoform X2 [Lates japonicus]
MEEPANRINGVFTSQDSSLSSLDYSDLTLSLPALPTSEASGREDKENTLFGSPTPTSQDQRYGMDAEDLSQWQNEFRSQIRALRQWLKSMEMRLPPLDPKGDLLRPQGDRGAGESGSIVPGLDSQASEVLGTGGPLYT